MGEREGFVRKTIALLVLGLAPVAGAQIKSSLALRDTASPIQAPVLSATVLSADPSSVVLGYDISGAESWDQSGDPDNWARLADVGSDSGFGNAAVIDGVAWALSIETVGSSLLSEANIYIDDAVNPDGTGLKWAPGAADHTSGTAAYTSGGILDLTGQGVGDIPLPDGWMFVEFFESHDHYPDAMDAQYLSGSVLYVSVHPEPVTIALLGLGTAGLVARRRQVRS